MSDGSLRSVDLERLSKGRYRVTNQYGDTLVVGEGGDGTFSPVDLLLTAIAACSAIDLDYIVGKRAEPTSFRLRSSGEKVRDEEGNHLVDLAVTFDARYAEDEAGKAALDVLPRAIAQSHDRICTVSRTVQIGAEVASRIERLDEG